MLKKFKIEIICLGAALFTLLFFQNCQPMNGLVASNSCWGLASSEIIPEFAHDFDGDGISDQFSVYEDVNEKRAVYISSKTGDWTPILFSSGLKIDNSLPSMFYVNRDNKLKALLLNEELELVDFYFDYSQHALIEDWRVQLRGVQQGDIGSITFDYIWNPRVNVENEELIRVHIGKYDTSFFSQDDGTEILLESGLVGVVMGKGGCY